MELQIKKDLNTKSSLNFFPITSKNSKLMVYSLGKTKAEQFAPISSIYSILDGTISA